MKAGKSYSPKGWTLRVPCVLTAEGPVAIYHLWNLGDLDFDYFMDGPRLCVTVNKVPYMSSQMDKMNNSMWQALHEHKLKAVTANVLHPGQIEIEYFLEYKD